MTLLGTNIQRLNLLRPSRETMLLAAAGLMAVAVAFAHHERPQAAAAHDSKDQVWTGQLASAVPANPGLETALSSASLVVPKEQLALPPEPPKTKFHFKAVCDSADLSCIPRLTVAPAPPPAAPPRKVAMAEDKPATAWGLTAPRPPGLIPPARPDHKVPGHPSILANVGRPFTAIGQTVAGWIKWL